MSKEKQFLFITMGITALNSVLMANGIETMPNMWVSEVYQNPMLGASIGGMTGVGIGGAIAAASIATTEAVKTGIDLIRDKFSDKTENKKLVI